MSGLRVAPCLPALAALALATSGCDGLFGVDFDDARPRPVGGGGGSGGAGGSGGGPMSDLTWTRLALLDGGDGLPHAATDRVRAIWCESEARCLVVTSGPNNEPGNVYAATPEAVTALLFEGSSVGETIAFIGISPTPDGAVARTVRSEPLIRAAGDFMSPASWSAIDPGDLWNLDNTLVGQLFFQVAAGGARLALADVVLTTDLQPAEDTVWVPRWSPPGVPTNFTSLKLQDDLVCDSGPKVGRGPSGYVSDDLQLIAYPAGNGLDDEYAGACISTDGGSLFRYAPLPEGEIASGGPSGLRCLDPAHCWLIGDDLAAAAIYVFYGEGTLGAGGAAAITWARATIAGSDAQRTLADIAFTADGQHGWAVGTEGPGRGLVLASDDGGRTWGDNLVAGDPDFQGVELYSVFAIDAQHVLVGGSQGLLMSAARSP